MRKATWTAVAILLFLVTQAFAQSEQSVRPQAILADLEDHNMSAEEIRTTGDIQSVNFVSLETFSGADFQDLQQILDETEDAFAEIRTAIEANETFQTELKARHLSVSQVVAVTRNDAGNATIYYNLPSP